MNHVSISWTKGIFHGVASTALSVLACMIYNQVYSTAYYVDFSAVINPSGIIITSALSCFLMSLTYVLLSKWKGEKLLGWANVLFSIISFATIIGVLSFKLPLDMEAPEMFPGLAIPMHFFPVLSFLSIYPFFKANNQ